MADDGMAAVSSGGGDSKSGGKGYLKCGKGRYRSRECSIWPACHLDGSSDSTPKTNICFPMSAVAVPSLSMESKQVLLRGKGRCTAIRDMEREGHCEGSKKRRQSLTGDGEAEFPPKLSRKRRSGTHSKSCPPEDTFPIVPLRIFAPDEGICKLSDNFADSCRTFCKMCGLSFHLYRMRGHTISKHDLQITRYKKLYGPFEVIDQVFHKCHVCGKIVLLDRDALGGHVKGMHKMKERDYTERFMIHANQSKRKVESQPSKIHDKKSNSPSSKQPPFGLSTASSISTSPQIGAESAVERLVKNKIGRQVRGMVEEGSQTGEVLLGEDVGKGVQEVRENDVVESDEDDVVELDEDDVVDLDEGDIVELDEDDLAELDEDDVVELDDSDMVELGMWVQENNKGLEIGDDEENMVLLDSVSTMVGVINMQEVEQFLQATTSQVISLEYTTSTLFKVGNKLVELVNIGLSHNCPSADGFKFVVHATVQEQWGQGCLLGASCKWDWVRDKVISISHNTDKISVCLVVFFVKLEGQVEDGESAS